MRPQGPTIAKWQLGHQLRLLREGATMTHQDAAKLLGCSHAKIYKIERGENNVNQSELGVLLDRYGVHGQEQRDAMLQLQREGKRRGWWADYGAKLPAPLVTYIGLESAADLARLVEPTVVPGILQTEEYARCTIWAAPTEAEPRVEVRMARKKRLYDGDEPLVVRAVVDEAVIRRTVGGPEVMRGQLEHLLELMELPTVRLQVLPFRAGAYPASLGPFVILEFPDDVHSPVVYTEGMGGDAYMEKSQDVRRCSLTFEDCQSSALSVPDTHQLIAEQLQALA